MPAIALNTSRFLDLEMSKAINDFAASGWSPDGQETYIRKRMEKAYTIARELEGIATSNTEHLQS